MSFEEAVELLGIDPNYASESELKSARNLLARRFDYDNSENKEQAQRINEAYQILHARVKARSQGSAIFEPENSTPTESMSIETVDQKLQQAKQQFIRIFEQERKEAIEKGPFNATDLQAFMDKYHKLKDDANKEFLQLMEERKNIQLAQIAMKDDKKIAEPKGNVAGLPGPTIKEERLGLPDKAKRRKASDAITNKEVVKIINELTSPKKEVGPVKQKDEVGFPRDAERGLLQIINELTDGLDLKKGDHKKLRASNIQVKESFKHEMHSGNYVYNIVHLIPSIMKVPVQLLTRLKDKIFEDPEALDRTAILKERIDRLDDKDLNIIYEEYRGNRVIQEAFPTVLNDLLNQRVHEYVMDNVENINSRIKSGYLQIFSDYRQLQEINEVLKNGYIDDGKTMIDENTRTNLEQWRNELIQGKAELIKEIREDQKEGRKWLSGGLHGFEEDMKAAESKMSYIGKRFAKSHDLDHDLLAKQAELERDEKQALYMNDDAKAMKAFLQNEVLLSSNTEIKNSIVGKRSTGKKYYSPLAEMLDYRPDPFTRDLFTSIAVTGATLNAVNGLATQLDAHKVLKEQQEEAMRANAQMEQAHNLGNDITSNQETFAEGMKATTAQSINSTSGVIERSALDKNEWITGTDVYHRADAMGHAYYNNLYQRTENAFADIANKYSSGAINQSEALDAISGVANRAQENLVHVYESCKPVMEEYAKTHSHFDLDGVMKTMDHIIENPTAITEMNDAIVGTLQAGEELANLATDPISVFQELPTDLRTTLLGATSTAAFASQVASSMGAQQKANEYGNTVTDMVDEFIQNQKATAYGQNMSSKAA